MCEVYKIRHWTLYIIVPAQSHPNNCANCGLTHATETLRAKTAMLTWCHQNVIDSLELVLLTYSGISGGRTWLLS